jgi:2',3'-cyclic-nucleotide 2'-phosphodiesterase (5'-nucleotidase family)
LLGGLARRVDYVEKIRSERQWTLVLDSGDLFFGVPVNPDKDAALKKARLIGRAYRRMGAVAVNVGDLDLLQGVDFLRQEHVQGLPFVSANLLDPSKQRPFFPPYLIREISGIRVAFFGLLPPESGPQAGPAIRGANEGKILITDPAEAARKTMQELKGRADLIILLSDLGLYQDQMVAKAVPGIHFILGGHEGRLLGRSQQTGETYILQSSTKGMYVGRLRVLIEGPGLPLKDENEPQHIQEKMKALDSHLRWLEQAKERPGQSIENLNRTIRAVNREKSVLQKKLEQVQKSASLGNRFLFALEPMEVKLPEDGEVLKWISDAGIDKD